MYNYNNVIYVVIGLIIESEGYVKLFYDCFGKFLA